MKPTTEQFAAYQGLFDYFNRELFNGDLPPCMLNFSRRARSRGFFVNNIWTEGDDATTHEISLNPDCLDRPAADSISTLVHEMAHLWQQAHGTPPRRAYHDRQWSAKMEAIGLMPSTTGEQGGKKVGQKMTHYIIEGGPYLTAFQRMPAELLLPWKTNGQIGKETKGKKKSSKRKYTCPSCNANAWGKEGLAIVCGECEEAFEMEEGES